MAIGELVGGQVVEGEVQVEDIDAGFAEEAKLAAFGVAGDELSNGGLREVTLVGYACDLEVSSGGGDVGIEAGAGCCDEVDGDVGVWVVLLQGGDVSRYTVD